MSRFVFELAAERDEAGLRRVYGQNSMEGDVGLNFRREPNYFFGARTQGPFCQVVSMHDRQTNEVIGVGTRAVRPGFINGKVEDIGYLGDLRVDARYRGGPLVARVYRYLAQLHHDRRTRIYFTVITEGNERALTTIAAGRAGIPPYHDFGRFRIPAVNFVGTRCNPRSNIQIVRGTPERLTQIVACLNRNYQRRQFAPFYQESDFAQTASNRWVRDFKINDFYVALRGNEVIGVVAKWDQSAYKQTVVTHYKGKLRFCVPLFNLAAPLIGRAPYPAPGRPLQYFYASFIAVDKDDVDVFRSLLSRLYSDHVGTSYNYFLIGLHERDPLFQALADFHLTDFSTRLFAVCFEDGQTLLNKLDKMLIPYIEFAMI